MHRLFFFFFYSVLYLFASLSETRLEGQSSFIYRQLVRTLYNRLKTVLRSLLNIPLIFKIAPSLIRPCRVSAWETFRPSPRCLRPMYLRLGQHASIYGVMAIYPSVGMVCPARSTRSVQRVHLLRVLRACSEICLLCLVLESVCVGNLQHSCGLTVVWVDCGPR